MAISVQSYQLASIQLLSEAHSLALGPKYQLLMIRPFCIFLLSFCAPLFLEASEQKPTEHYYDVTREAYENGDYQEAVKYADLTHACLGGTNLQLQYYWVMAYYLSDEINNTSKAHLIFEMLMEDPEDLPDVMNMNVVEFDFDVPPLTESQLRDMQEVAWYLEHAK